MIIVGGFFFLLVFISFCSAFRHHTQFTLDLLTNSTLSIFPYSRYRWHALVMDTITSLRTILFLLRFFISHWHLFGRLYNNVAMLYRWKKCNTKKTSSCPSFNNVDCTNCGCATLITARALLGTTFSRGIPRAICDWLLPFVTSIYGVFFHSDRRPLHNFSSWAIKPRTWLIVCLWGLFLIELHYALHPVRCSWVRCAVVNSA